MTIRQPARGMAATLAFNAVWNLARYAINWLVLLAVPPFLIHHLTTDTYATWILLLQIAAYYSIMDTHLQTAVARFVARSAALADRADLRATIASIAVFLSGLACVTFVPGLLAAISFDRIFPAIPANLAYSARISALIVVCSIVLALPFTTMVGTFLGFQRNRVVTTAIVVSKVAGAVGMIVAVNLGGALIALACCFAAGTLLAPLVYLIAWGRSRDVEPIIPSAMRKSIVKDFARYSSALGFIALSSILGAGLALPIISFYDFQGVTPYSLALVYGNMLLIPQSAILAVVLPILSKRSVEGDAAMMGRILLRFARLSSLPLIVFTTGLLLAAPAFLRLWIGADLAEQALRPAILLIAAQFVTLTLHPYRFAVLGVGQQMGTTIAVVLEGVCSVGLAFVLVQYWGATGVALAALLAACIGLAAQCLISMPRTIAILVSRRAYILAGFVRPLLAIAPAAGLMAFFWNQDLSLFAWMMVTGIGVLASLSVGLLVCLDPVDRALAVAIVKAKLRRSAVPEMG